jgi:hypothetical protein
MHFCGDELCALVSVGTAVTAMLPWARARIFRLWRKR